MITTDDTTLGVRAGDQDLDLVGAVALDHHGRVGLITSRRKVDSCGGCWVWFGVLAAPFGDRWAPGHWRWTAARPLVIAQSLREYAEATDDLLGLDELQRRKALAV